MRVEPSILRAPSDLSHSAVDQLSTKGALLRQPNQRQQDPQHAKILVLSHLRNNVRQISTHDCSIRLEQDVTRVSPPSKFRVCTTVVLNSRAFPGNERGCVYFFIFDVPTSNFLSREYFFGNMGPNTCDLFRTVPEFQLHVPAPADRASYQASGRGEIRRPDLCQKFDANFPEACFVVEPLSCARCAQQTKSRDRHVASPGMICAWLDKLVWMSHLFLFSAEAAPFLWSSLLSFSTEVVAVCRCYFTMWCRRVDVCFTAYYLVR